MAGVMARAARRTAPAVRIRNREFVFMGFRLGGLGLRLRVALVVG
jgi:hypothetical protein